MQNYFADYHRPGGQHLPTNGRHPPLVIFAPNTPSLQYPSQTYKPTKAASSIRPNPLVQPPLLNNVNHYDADDPYRPVHHPRPSHPLLLTSVTPTTRWSNHQSHLNEVIVVDDTDRSPIEHNQAPSIDDRLPDVHADDDLANEEGEVIQESNAVPLVPGQVPSSSSSVNEIDESSFFELNRTKTKRPHFYRDIVDGRLTTMTPSTTAVRVQTQQRPTTSRTIATTTASENTQTEANRLVQPNVVESQNVRPPKQHVRPLIPLSPSAIMINELRSKPYQQRQQLHRKPIPAAVDQQPPAFHQRPILLLEPPPPPSTQKLPVPRPTAKQQMSMLINSIGVDNTVNVRQTEKPFDPKLLTERQRNVSTTTTTTSAPPPSTMTTTTVRPSPPSPTTTTTPRPTTTTTTATTTKPTTVGKPIDLSTELELNTGEVTTTATAAAANDYEIRDAGEIFDYHESNNPHNFGLITVTGGGDIPPEPSTDMRPPPPQATHRNPPKYPHRGGVPASVAAIEEVMGLSPPPIQQSPSTTDASTSDGLPAPELPQNDNATTLSQQQKSPPLVAQPYKVINRGRVSIPLSTEQPPPPPPSPTMSTPSNIRSSTPRGTKSPYRQITRRPTTANRTTYQTLRPIGVTPAITVRLPINHHQSMDKHVRVDIQPTPIVWIPDVITDETPPFASTIDATKRRRTYTQLHTAANPLSEVLILGAEPTASRPIVVTATPTIVDVPTKYITNTHTLTVTTTKTTVIRSQGITSTLTLTLTKTSTIVDTVTEQVTHTFIAPTATSTTNPASIMSTTVLPTASTTPSFIVDDSDMIPLDEFIVNYDGTNDIAVYPAAAPKVPASTLMTQPPPPYNNHQSKAAAARPPPTHENDSIFIVMTDHRPSTIAKINSSIIDTVTNINAMGDHLDDDDDVAVADLPHRDEDRSGSGEVNHVLLGGILIASPSSRPTDVAATRGTAGAHACRPDCKATRNELCQRIDRQMRCMCRPGFARMFPDRPCKRKFFIFLFIEMEIVAGALTPRGLCVDVIRPRLFDFCDIIEIGCFRVAKPECASNVHISDNVPS